MQLLIVILLAASATGVLYAGGCLLWPWVTRWHAKEFEKYHQWAEELRIDWSEEKLRRTTLIAMGFQVGAVPILYIVTGNALVALVGGGCIYWLPLTIFHWERKKRLASIEAQIPEAVELLIADVRSGCSLSSAITNVAQILRDKPIGQELARIVTDIGHGVSLRDALHGAQTRLNIESFTLVSTALKLCLKQGGNILPILERIAKSTAKLAGLRNEIKLESAGIRKQGTVILCMTPLFLGVLCLMSGEMSHTLFHTLLGNILLLFVAAIQAVGIWWFCNIVKATV